MSRVMYARLFVLVGMLLIITGCSEAGTTVRPDATPQYDTTPNSFVDTRRPAPYATGGAQAPTILVESSPGFTLPPNLNAREELQLSDRAREQRKDAIKIWIWNDGGAAKYELLEGETIANARLSVTLEVNALGSNDDSAPRAYLLLNGKPVPVLAAGEQVRVGSTMVYVSDIASSNWQ